MLYGTFQKTHVVLYGTCLSNILELIRRTSYCIDLETAQDLHAYSSS